MSAYAELLGLARTQVASAAGGDLESAVALMGARQQLIDAAPLASAGDEPLIAEVLRLDRQLAGFIRERMLQIHEESLKLQRGRVAMRGYGSYQHSVGQRINRAR